MSNVLTNIINIIKDPKFYVILIVLVVIIILIGALQMMRGVEKMMSTTITYFLGSKIDGWSISHIILYIYFGYYFPYYFIEFLIIGTIWEGIENLGCIGRDKIPAIFECKDIDSFICEKAKHLKKCYWYGRIEDPAMNMIGFVIGACLSPYKNKKN